MVRTIVNTRKPTRRAVRVSRRFRGNLDRIRGELRSWEGGPLREMYFWMVAGDGPDGRNSEVVLVGEGKGWYPELNSEEEQFETPLSRGSRDIGRAFPDAEERGPG